MDKARIAVLLADGHEEVEALTIVDYARRAGLEVDLLSISDQLPVTGAHGIKITADYLLQDRQTHRYDLVALPGGLAGMHNLSESEAVLKFLREQDQAGRYVAAICAAPCVLEKAGLLKNRRGTCYPGFEEGLSFVEYKTDLVVQDGNLITSRGPATAIYFALYIVEVLLGKEKRAEVEQGLLLPLVEKAIQDGKSRP